MPVLQGSRLALELSQQLAVGANAPRVLVVTCGTFTAAEATATPDAVHGGLWGLLRVLRLERARESHWQGAGPTYTVCRISGA